MPNHSGPTRDAPGSAAAFELRHRNQRFSGVVAGVAFKRGIGRTDDPKRANQCVLEGCACRNNLTGLTVPISPARPERRLFQ